MGKLVDAASQLTSKISEAAVNAEEWSQVASQRLEQKRHQTAAALHGAAAGLRATRGNVHGKIDEVVTSAANRLDDAASYVHHGRKARTELDMERAVVAGAACFLVGLTLWRALRPR